MSATFDLTGKKALVVGLGDTGASCVRWLMERDAVVRATDSRAEPPHAQHLREAFPEVPLTLGGFDAADFAWAELIVVSPGVPLATPQIQAALAAGKDVAGDVELFARALPAQGGGKVIAITGSNGKSTVTALTGHLCAAYGLDAVVAGNIGLPVLEALEAREAAGRYPDVWVLELSSFQLETTSSLHADAATVLNLSQDHMDRYAGMDDYAAAKARVFGGIGQARPARVQVLNRDDPMTLAMARPDWIVWTFGIPKAAAHAPCPMPHPPGYFGISSRPTSHIENDLPSLGGSSEVASRGPSPAPRKERIWLADGEEALLPVDKLPITGLHNAANALAALALCRAIGLEYAGLIPALKTFEGLPHRVQRVGELEDRVFYDDSKGTNVGATVAAVNGMYAPVVLIVGGDGKGQDFSPLREVSHKARAVVQIGRDGPLIAAAMGGACPMERAESMAEAVQTAFRLSQPGDAILLSPACASFDMFRDYKHRAEVFVAAVDALCGQLRERRRAERRAQPQPVAHERRRGERRGRRAYV